MTAAGFFAAIINLFQHADFFIIFFGTRMEREVCDILDGIGRLQPLEIFLGCTKLINVFPEGFREIIYNILRHIGAGEHDHLDCGGLYILVLIRIPSRKAR